MTEEIHALRANSILQTIEHEFYMMSIENNLEEQIKIISEILELKKSKMKLANSKRQPKEVI